ncbi:hypothetical protein L1987_51748 [Smallanthus sonchifolius]|uniref:Uncharacterized protein n=1 Tax=Smallanthus sonchifolius TaxID=185202 RepID=A0ACB9ESB4_9ASTR|nr:hypothetical protein L1987_51748 [Smallanthus sonchifolius]
MLFGVRVKVDPMRKSVSMNDLSQYVPVQPATRDLSNNSNSNNLDGSAAVAADSGYASADDAVRHQSNGGRERKRGVPWTEDEHKLFLLGLQKVGKGDWRRISRNFVKTRTPTQVASHAQKYFLRHSNLNRRRRRSSLFDITTDSVPMEEEQVHEDNNNSQPMQISPLSGFPMATVGPVASPLLINNYDQFNCGPTLLARPIPLLPTASLSTRGDDYLDQKRERDSLSLSLSLNLSLSSSGDGITSVG